MTIIPPMRAFAAGLAATFVLVAAGCGGSTAGGGGAKSDGAKFVPAGAPGFVYLNSDFESSQWKTLDALASKFPNREKLLAMLRSQLQQQGVDFEQDVKPAVGPETDIGILKLMGDVGNVLGLTQPKDKGKFDALLKKLDAASGGKPTVSEESNGWTLFSDDQAAIASAKQAYDGKSLADDDAFKTAMDELPGDALAKLYLNGAALTQQLAQALNGVGTLTGGGRLTSVAADVDVRDNGVGLHAITHTTGGAAPKTYKSALVSEVPSGVLLYASFNGIGGSIKQAAANPQLQAQLGQVQQLLGVSLTQLASLFDREGALYVRQGAPLPEVTLVLQVASEQQALATVDRLVRRVGALLGGLGVAPAAPTTTTVAGVKVRKLSLGSFALYYGAFGGKLVLSDSTSGISGLKDSGAKLKDDPVFKGAKDAAGMPDSTTAFFYVNIKDAVPLIENFAQTAGQPIPSDVMANLAPLRTFLAYGTGEKGKSSLTGFLEIK
jgi:hypothetical protein